jgi:hypothetical protein
MSGFEDHLSGKVITNAFTIGLLDPERVESEWQKIEKIEDAPVLPVLRMIGLVVGPSSYTHS